MPDIGHVKPGNDMYHIIYKITNRINEKYYIGRHSTDDIDDGYMGSGLGIINAIRKYGKENFTKEVIAEAKNSEELWELEADIVDEKVVNDPLSYNIAYGGKHYLYSLKKYDFEAFIEHQRKAGQAAAAASKHIRNRDWHVSGGSKSSRMRHSQYIYKIVTKEGDEYLVNGIDFKILCAKKEWNYKTLHAKAMERNDDPTIKRGKHKGFQVTQVQKYNK